MTPWLLSAMQNGDLQDPSLPRRPPVHTAEEILRDAMQKHTNNKSTALNSARKPSYRPVGLSRLQFGDGEFDSGVISFQKFPDPISPAGQLPRVRAMVHATRTMSRVMLEKRRVSVYGDGEDHEDGDEGFENGDEEGNCEDEREGLLARFMTINNRGQPKSYDADGLTTPDESVEILEGSELISCGRQGPVMSTAPRTVGSGGVGSGGVGSGGVGSGGSGSSRFRRFASSQLSVHEGEERGLTPISAVNHQNLRLCVTTTTSCTGGSGRQTGDDNMNDDVVQAEEESFVQQQQPQQLPRTFRFQFSGPVTSVTSVTSVPNAHLAVLRPPYNRRISEIPSDLFEARGPSQPRARSQQYHAFFSPNDDSGGGGGGSGADGGGGGGSNGSVRARIGSCSGAGPSLPARVSHRSSNSPVVRPQIPTQISISNSPVSPYEGEGPNTERVNQLLNDLRKLGGTRLDAAASPGGGDGDGDGDGDGTPTPTITAAAAATLGGANAPYRMTRSSSNMRLLHQRSGITGSVARSEVSDERSASYSQLQSYSHSQLQYSATAIGRSSNGPGLTVRVPQISTVASNSTPGSGGSGGGLGTASQLASPGMPSIRDSREDDALFPQDLASPTILQLAGSPTLAQVRAVMSVQSSPTGGSTAAAAAAAGRSFTHSPTRTPEAMLAPTIPPPLPSSLPLPRATGAPLDGWTNKRPSNHNAVRRTATVSSFSSALYAMAKQDSNKMMERFSPGDGDGGASPAIAAVPQLPLPPSPSPSQVGEAVSGGEATEEVDSRRSAAWKSRGAVSSVSSVSSRRIAFEGPPSLAEPPPLANDAPLSGGGAVSPIMSPRPGPAPPPSGSSPGRGLGQLFARVRDAPRRAQSSSFVFDLTK